jgi:hypothetical protein
MKILSVANVSNLDDLASDSGIVFLTLVLSEFARLGHEVVLIGPDHPAFLTHPMPQIRKVSVNLGVSKYSARFSFDWEGFSRVVREFRPDVIFNNQAELAPNLRAVLVSSGLHAQIVSYCHYTVIGGVEGPRPIPDPAFSDGHLGEATLLSMLAGLHASDVSIVQSNFARSAILAAGAYYKIGIGRLEVIPPPADPRFMHLGTLAVSPVRRLLYNHRLYESYGTAQFINLVRNLSGRIEFELVVADCMPRRSEERNRLDSSPNRFKQILSELPGAKIVQTAQDRAGYLDLIKTSRVALAAQRSMCVWSMSVVDCMGLGVPVVAPALAAYPEFVPAWLLGRSLDEQCEITARLMIDDDFWLDSARACIIQASKLVLPSIAENILALFYPRDQSN